jgi:hypothetical protein
VTSVYHPSTITIENLDGTTEHVEDITRTHVAGGVLHLFRRWSFEHREEHAGSYPLESIRKWTEAGQ